MDQPAFPLMSPHDIPHCSFAKALHGLYKVQRNEQNCPLIAAEQIAGLSYLSYLSSKSTEGKMRSKGMLIFFSSAYYPLPPPNGSKTDQLHLHHCY